MTYVQKNGKFVKIFVHDVAGWIEIEVSEKEYFKGIEKDKKKDEALIGILQDFTPFILKISIFIVVLMLLTNSPVNARESKNEPSRIIGDRLYGEELDIEIKKTLFQEIKDLTYRISSKMYNQISRNKIKSAAIVLGATTLVTTGVIFRKEIYWNCEDFLFGPTMLSPKGFDWYDPNYNYLGNTNVFREHVNYLTKRSRWDFEKENLKMFIKLLTLLEENQELEKYF